MNKTKIKKIKKNNTKKNLKSRQMSFKIAIPSHDRFDLIQDTTLKLLKKHKVDFKNVFIFCSPESFSKYSTIKQKYGLTLVRSKKNIKDKRNHIINFFKNNQKIVEMDDDIEDIMNTKKNIKRSSVKDLIGFYEDSFKVLGKKGLWGINSTNSTLSPSGKDSFGTYTIVGACCGYYNDKRINLTVDEKEDFERVVQFYKLQLPILKRGAYGIKTKYWTNPGGIQSRYSKEERIKVQKKSAELLMEKYPGIFNKLQRANGLIDLRFKSRNPLKY